jgi:RNA polymerase sigma factor (sigma-70 family)
MPPDRSHDQGRAPGPDQQLERLVRDYARVIRSAVAKVAGRRHLADRVVDDVEQEVRIALWKRLRSEQPIEHASSYVFKAARREAIRALRRETARKNDDPPEGWERLEDPGAGPLEALQTQALGARIEAALQKLAPDRQRAVRARLVGLEYDEIERLTGWAYDRTRNLVSRGLADLRKLIGDDVT